MSAPPRQPGPPECPALDVDGAMSVSIGESMLPSRDQQLQAPSSPPATRGSRRARTWRLVGLTVVLAILVPVGLRGRLPSLPQVFTVLSGAQLGWVALALGLQAISMTAFAMQQRLLLAALGVRVGIGRAVAVTLARSAISITLPAGGAVSAGYAIRQYRRAGASGETAATTMVVSGLVSIAGLIVLSIGGGAELVAQNPATVATWPLAAVAIGGVVLALLSVALGLTHARRSAPTITEPQPAPPTGRLRRVPAQTRLAVRDAWLAGASLRARDWFAAVAYATVNWLTDLLCLAGVTRALGLPIGMTTLAGIYLGVQIVRQIPITPGGIGLIETALVAGLTAAGSTAAVATASVLIYRLLSCWLIIPAGGLAGLALRRSLTMTGIPRALERPGRNDACAPRPGPASRCDNPPGQTPPPAALNESFVLPEAPRCAVCTTDPT
jgi:uncharacterized membrane protein YbhN (UPF0104 family)